MIKFFSAVILVLIFMGCNQHPGCTDCEATNFDAAATKNDGSCVYLNSDKVGTFYIYDSIVSPFGDISYRNYSIQFYRGLCDTVGLQLKSYGAINLTTQPITVKCKVISDSIFIPQQFIEGQNTTSSSDDYLIDETGGFFSSDSIYLNFGYTNLSQHYYGACRGKKQ